MRTRWKYIIKDEKKLSILLWFDVIIGAILGVTGLLFYSFFSKTFGVPENIFIWISSITLLYAISVLRLVQKKPVSILLLWVKLAANVIWALIIVGIMSLHFTNPTTLGHVYFAIHIALAGGLGWLERNQIDKKDMSNLGSL